VSVRPFDVHRASTMAPHARARSSLVVRLHDVGDDRTCEAQDVRRRDPQHVLLVTASAKDDLVLKNPSVDDDGNALGVADRGHAADGKPCKALDRLRPCELENGEREDGGDLPSIDAAVTRHDRNGHARRPLPFENDRLDDLAGLDAESRRRVRDGRGGNARAHERGVDAVSSDVSGKCLAPAGGLRSFHDRAPAPAGFDASVAGIYHAAAHGLHQPIGI
jgi:hypothetical protein